MDVPRLISTWEIHIIMGDGRGVEANKKKAKHYYEIAAMKGSVTARHNLGCVEGNTGNHQRAMKHFMLAAKAGDKDSLDQVKKGFMDGAVTKDEYAGTLRAFHGRQTEMKSEARDKAAELHTAYQTTYQNVDSIK